MRGDVSRRGGIHYQPVTCPRRSLAPSLSCAVHNVSVRALRGYTSATTARMWRPQTPRVRSSPTRQSLVRNTFDRRQTPLETSPPVILLVCGTCARAGPSWSRALPPGSPPPPAAAPTPPSVASLNQWELHPSTGRCAHSIAHSCSD